MFGFRDVVDALVDIADGVGVLSRAAVHFLQSHVRPKVRGVVERALSIAVRPHDPGAEC